MSNQKNNEFAGEILSAEITRKGIYELGKVDRVPPSVGIFDAPTRCFIVNQEWWSHIAGMVHLLADVVSWKDATDEDYFAIREILRFMQGMECMDFSLRQNPADSCILQQTTDGGETWTDVFDFSLCATIQDKTYQVQIQNSVTYVQPTFQEIYNSYTTNYAGTPESVHPNLDDPTGDSAAHRAAYCNALWTLVNTACDTAISFYNETVNATQSEINLYLGITGFILTAIALAAAVPTAGASLAGLAAVSGLWAAGIGLGATLGNALVDFWQQHTIDQFQDEQAKEDVVCYLFDALPPGDNTLEAMRSAVSGVITGDPNGQAILDFLEILLEHDSTYAAFLEKWSNNKEYAEAGIELYCPCLTGYILWEWDFRTMGQGDFYLDPAVDTTPPGEFQAGVGWVGTGDPSHPRLRIAMPFNPNWHIRAVGAQVDWTFLTHGGARAWAFRPTQGSITGQSVLNLSNGVQYQWCRNSLNSTGFNEMALDAFVSNGAGHVIIEKIAIIFDADKAKIDAASRFTEDLNMCD